MASYYPYGAMPTQPGAIPHHNNNNHHHHHGGRNRRNARLSVSQNPQRQYRGVRGGKDMDPTAALHAFRNRFESMRSFDLEDDMEFCPALLTEGDFFCMSASERSSLASNSPASSPTQQPQSVAPAFALNSTSPPFVPPSLQSQQPSVKLFQPAASRGRNAIPIINPLTGIPMTSPPPSVSPARMQQAMGHRW